MAMIVTYETSTKQYSGSTEEEQLTEPGHIGSVSGY